MGSRSFVAGATFRLLLAALWAAQALTAWGAGFSILSVREGSPAAGAGLRAGDRAVGWRLAVSEPFLRRGFASPFDWPAMETEGLGAGPVLLTLSRDGSEIDACLEDPRYLEGVTVAWEEGEDAAARAALLAASRGDVDLAARLARGLPPGLARAWVHHAIGVECQRIRRTEDALAQADAALATAGEPLAPSDCAFLIESRGYAGCGGEDSGGRDFDEAADLWRDQARPLSLAHCLWFRASCLLDGGRGEEAEPYAREALELRELHAPGSWDEAEALNTVGIARDNAGDLEEAGILYRRALAIVQARAPEADLTARVLNNLAGIEDEEGQYEAAERHYRRALTIFGISDPNGIDTASTMSNLSTVLDHRGQTRECLELLKQALPILEKRLPESLQVATVLNNLGTLSDRARDVDAALSYYGRALVILELKGPGGPGLAETMQNLGSLYISIGRLADARALITRALAIFERLEPESPNTAAATFNLGTIADNLGQAEEALRDYRAVERIQRRIMPGTAELADTIRSVAHKAKQLGRLAEAVALLKEAVSDLDAQLETLGGSEEVRSAFMDSQRGAHLDLIQYLVEAGRSGEAFRALERSRAQVMLQVLSERRLLFEEDVPEALRKERQEILGAERSLYQGLAAAGAAGEAGGVQNLRRELEELRARLEENRRAISLASPRYGTLKYAVALGYAEASAALEPGTLLLSYAVLPDGVLMFAGGPGLALRVHRIDVDAARLRREILRLHAAITSQEDVRAVAHSLSQMLLAPEAERIARARRLLISPEGPLHFVPFACLADPNASPGSFRYLVEALPIHTALSATVYAELRGRKRAPGNAGSAFFGGPSPPERAPASAETASGGLADEGLRSPLPFSLREAESIAALFGYRAKLFTAGAATPSAVRSLREPLRTLHFACHGIMREEFPLESALALSASSDGLDDGLLRAWEIFESIRLDADLVTLSACRTALGREMGGEGVAGLTRAFQYAGARCLLASLWSVEDASTADFMTLFYSAYLKGMAKDEALRSAQLQFIRGTMKSGEAPAPTPADRSHPFYWAAFTLSGDAR